MDLWQEEYVKERRQERTMKKKPPTKRASRLGKRSRRKGVRGEQQWVHRLNKLLPDHAPFARDWLHSRQKQSRGDLVSTRESLISDYYIEVKSRTSVTNGAIRKWFADARKNANKLGRNWVLLCVHQTAGPWFVFTDRMYERIDKWPTKKADLMIVPINQT